MSNSGKKVILVSAALLLSSSLVLAQTGNGSTGKSTGDFVVPNGLSIPGDLPHDLSRGDESRPHRGAKIGGRDSKNESAVTPARPGDNTPTHPFEDNVGGRESGESEGSEDSAENNGPMKGDHNNLVSGNGGNSGSSNSGSGGPSLGDANHEVVETEYQGHYPGQIAPASFAFPASVVTNHAGLSATIATGVGLGGLNGGASSYRHGGAGTGTVLDSCTAGGKQFTLTDRMEVKVCSSSQYSSSGGVNMQNFKLNSLSNVSSCSRGSRELSDGKVSNFSVVEKGSGRFEVFVVTGNGDVLSQEITP